MKKKLFFSGCLLAAVFVNAQGPSYQWAKRFGSTADDEANRTVLDASGNVYTACRYQGTVDFDPGSGTTNLTSAGGIDICITKLTASGNFVWAKSIGGSLNDQGGGISIDASGNFYISGNFQGTADFDPNPSTSNNLTSAGGRDFFVTKWDASGNFVWAKRIGGTSDDFGSTKIDASGNLWVYGSFEGTVDFDPGTGTTNLTSAGGTDIFISKWDASGNFSWVKSMGGTTEDLLYSLSFDASGNILHTGTFTGTADLDPSSSASYNLTSAGGTDIYISKLDASGNFIWAIRIGSSGDNESPNGFVLDGSGNVYTAGAFQQTADFDPSPSTTYNLTAAGVFDVFISKLDASGNFVWAKRLGGSYADRGYGIALDGAGNVYTIGYFSSKADFDPGTATYYLSTASAGDINMFLSKLDANGNFVWAQNYGARNAYTYGFGLTLDAYGNIYATGRFTATVDFDLSTKKANLTSAGGNDIFVLKLSQASGFMTASDEENQSEITGNTMLYPNPTTGIINLQFGVINPDNVKIQVLNQMGQIVMEEANLQYSTFNIQHLADGLYLIRVLGDNKIITTQKVIKQ